MSDQPQDIEKEKESKDPQENKEETPEKEGGGKKFSKPGKFNFYWIYGIIVVALIVSQWFQWTNGGEQKITRDKFFNEMLKPGDVDEIKVVNNSVAHVTIKRDRLMKKEEYKTVRTK